MKCPSCRSQNTRRIGSIPPDFRFAGRELDQLVGDGALVRCNRCHLRFRWPQADAETLKALYRQGDVNHWQYSEGSREDWKRAEAWLLEHHMGGHLLDVGCFDGAFLRGLGSVFLRYGIEPHPGAAERAHEAGIEIIGATLEDVDTSFDGFFDSIVAFDVIEHLTEPSEFVARARCLLRPGGSLVIASGSTDSLSWRFMGSRYWYCAIPEHISFINGQWVEFVARSNHMTVASSTRYAHTSNADVESRLSEVTKNVVCRLAPSLWRRLRARGYGGIDVSLSDRLRDYPPQWMTAKDHALVILRK